MAKLSVVINTLNEEKNLPRAIASVAKIAAEIVVVDMKSDDKTQEIAKNLGAKVYEHERTNYVEPARNYAISKALGDWIFILDADEEITASLREEILEVVNNPQSADFYYIPRKNIIFGKWIKHSRWWPDLNIRLFKKGNVSWSEKIHSVPFTKGKGDELKALEDLAIIHYNYRSISQYVERLNRYSSIQAKERVKEGYVFKWDDLIKKPAGEFFGRYFKGEGYKDGLHGLALSLLQAFSELVVILKTWELAGFREASLKVSDVKPVLDQFERDLNYWQADSLYEETKSPIERIKRKLRI